MDDCHEHPRGQGSLLGVGWIFLFNVIVKSENSIVVRKKSATFCSLAAQNPENSKSFAIF